MKNLLVKFAAALSCSVVAFATAVAEGTVDSSAPSIGEVSVTEAGDNFVTFSATITSLGDSATTATASFAYGVAAAVLDQTQEVAKVTTAGNVSLTLSRLRPNTIYRAALVLRNSNGKTTTSETIVIRTAQSPDMAMPSTIGLNQTFFTSADHDWTKDYTALPEGEDWTHYNDGDRVYRRELGTIMAYVGGSPGAQKYRSEVWFDNVYWPVNGGQWAYWGYMYMEAGKSYKFRSRIDDNERVVVTDPTTGTESVLINDIHNGNTLLTSQAFEPTTSGWHPIEVRISDGSGGLGGYDSSNSYKNTNNMGYSSDDGTTWNLMLDPGDGSLFRCTSAEGDISVSETTSGGTLTLSLSFAAAESVRTLAAVYGPQHGGNTDTNGWAKAVVVSKIAADKTAFTCAPPDGWGSDDCLVVRYCFIDDDGSVLTWSPSTYWRDVSEPHVTAIAADGSGGDTLVVTGEVSVPGEACSLQAYVGTSPETLKAWPGATATAAKSGAFSFTLFTDDLESELLLKPGTTYYVMVTAKTANGAATASEASTVTTAGAATFASASASNSRRNVTFKGALKDLGMTKTSSVTLWLGESNDASKMTQIGDALTITTADEFSFAHTVPVFDKTYYWQLRAANVSQGKTANTEARTAVASFSIADETTYTWCGGESGRWDDAANWSNNVDGDCTGYPQSQKATVVFPADTTATLTLSGEAQLWYLRLEQAGANITIKGDGTAASKLTIAQELVLTGKNSSLTVDGMTMSASVIYLGGSSTITIGDATLKAGYWLRFYAGTPKVRFVGSTPLLQIANNSGCVTPDSGRPGCDARLEFVVPAGGYATAPFQGSTSPSYYMGYWQNSRYAGTITIDIADESPAKRVDATLTTPLVSWANKGIDTNDVVRAGSLPTDAIAPSDNDAFVWGALTSTGRPLSLSVTLVGAVGTDSLVVTGEPKAVGPDGVSPGVGAHSVESGSSITCSAPDGIVMVSDTMRATCTGYRLYSVDAETREQTLVASGTEKSVTYKNEDGKPHVLAWQWKIERKITATTDGNGKAYVNGNEGSAWIEYGARAKVTTTANDGYFFGKWTGDVPAEHDKDQALSFVVRDQDYSFTASFLPIVYVSPTGNDSNAGTSWNSAMATIPAALAKDTAGTGICVLLADGVYESATQIKLTTGSTIAGANEGAKAVLKLTGRTSSNQYDAKEADSFIVLAHDDARLYNVAVTTGFTTSTGADGAFGRCVWIEKAGFVDHCVITNGATIIVNYSQSIYSKNPIGFGGGGVVLNGGGVVRGCDISRNAVFSQYYSLALGGNVAMTGGIVEGCRIVESNMNTGFTRMTMAGLAMSGGYVRSSLIALNDWTGTTEAGSPTPSPTGVYMGGGVLENCTVTANTLTNSSRAVGVYLLGSATVRNCIIWGNKNNSVSGVGNWSSTTWSYTSWTGDIDYTCTTPTPIGVGNVAVEPPFTDAGSGDFTLIPSSLTDSGIYRDWMDWSTDLAGVPRIAGSAPDIGCYEVSDEAVTAGFDISQSDAFDSVTLKAVVVGADTDEITYRWTLTPENGEAITIETNSATIEKTDIPFGRHTLKIEILRGGTVIASTVRDGIVIYPKDIYVSTDGSATFPYDTPEKATSDLAAAMEAAADVGSTIHIDEGLFRTEDKLVVTKGVTIVGEGPDKTFFQCTKSVADVITYMITLFNEDAVLSSLAVTGWDYSTNTKRLSRRGGGLMLYSGVVTNCWIMHHETANNTICGSGAQIYGPSTIVDCVFTNNQTTCSGGWGGAGGAVDMQAEGLIDRCSFLNNRVAGGYPSYGGGIRLTKGTVRNSFFAGNFSSHYCGGIYVRDSGKVYNCTIVNNKVETNYGGIYSANGGTIRNCLSYRNYHGTIVEDEDDPGFVDAANGDFRLSASSAAIDASESADLGDFDLDRNPRVSGEGADLGCYEFDQSQTAVGINYAKAQALGACDVLFTATAQNAVLDEAKCYWTFDGREPTANDNDAVGVSVTRQCAIGTVTVRFATEIGGKKYEIDRPEWFTVFGESVYVVTENENHAFPYATWETAATNVVDAMTAVQSGSTLIFGDGTFKIGSAYEFYHPVALTSLNGPEKTLLNFAWDARLTFDHADATFSNITVTNAFWNNASGNVITMKSGAKAENCVFTSCGTQGDAALGVYGGSSVVGCRIENCRASGTTSTAIYIQDAASIVDRCVVEGSRNYGQNKSASAVYVASGTLRNTVVANNALTNSPAVIAAGNSSRIENCTIVDNVDGGTSSVVAGLRIDSTGASVVNTIAYGNTSLGEVANVGGVSGYEKCLITSLTDGTDPRFRSNTKKPFVPTSMSPCANAGTMLSWMTAEALDLYGNPRIVGRKPDIGAVECQTGGGMYILLR